MEPSARVPKIPEELARRFVIRRCLGQGGFGVVYEAFDRSLGSVVALKELLTMEPAALYAFKQEFRALADVSHPNLVGLHELFFVEGHYYLTMELVRGVNFLCYVRPAIDARVDPSGERLALPATARRAMAAEIVSPATMNMSRIMVPPAALDQTMGGTSAAMTTLAMAEGARLPIMQPDAARGELDTDRLRKILAELAEGVFAIHRAGRAHRDLKPSNVLVTESGRPVILDFGLVGSFESLAHDKLLVVGTPAYMSPEQATGASGDAASDWYSIGVMLYEALTGLVPHLFEETSVEELLYAKHLVDPPDPRQFAPDVPEDLAELTMHLLARDPKARAGLFDVLRVARRDGASAGAAGLPVDFVGRSRELAAMREAFSLCLSTSVPVVLQVHGASGMGKSVLVRHFLDSLPSSGGIAPLLLEGRCHEREWVPYKAFDGAIDALARYLGEHDADALSPVLPESFSSLARIFPVLASLSATDPNEAQEAPDPLEVRRRAFAALRELFTRLAARGPLVLYMDDLQWADTDSAALLEALFMPPAPPPLLLVASHRTDEARSSLLVSQLPHPHRPSPGVEASEVVVGPLATEDAEALALSILGGNAEDSLEKAAKIAREASGNPFFVHELAQHIASGHSGEGLDVRGVVRARVSALPASAREVLEIVSAAGRPIEPVIIREAAGLEEEEGGRALSILRNQSLVRARGDRGEARIEIFHDKIRETVVSTLGEDVLRARHLALGHAMEGMSNADPEALAMHFRMAGDPARARAYMERAAQRAERALAFDRAATLYRLALELADPADEAAIELELGRALANAGRGAEAAKVLLSAAEKVSPEMALRARQRAAEHYLRAGHVDEGLTAARALLSKVGMRLPKTPRRALFNVVASRVKLKLRGYQFEERSEAELDPAVLYRIDLCWSLGNGLGGVDVLRSADFQARHLLLSLEAGEPYRIARAFSWEAILRSMQGEEGLAEARELSARASSIAERIQHPHALAWASASKAIVAHNGLRFREAAALCEETIALFREACTDVAWEVGSMYAWWLLTALFYIGDLRVFSELFPRCAAEAAALGDKYLGTALAAYIQPLTLLIEDRPLEAAKAADAALEHWTTNGYHSMHWAAVHVRVHAALYQGQGRRAHALFWSEIPRIEAAMMTRTSRSVRIRFADIRARTALAAAREVPDPGPLLREAERMTEMLESERSPWADACALGIHAALCARRDEIDRALALYHRARSTFLSCEHQLFARSVERRLGELEGGEAGRLRLAAVDAWFGERGVLRPDLFAATWIPR